MWRVAQVSDTHLGGDADGIGNNRLLHTLMPEIIRKLRHDLTKTQPDFILATGDLAALQTRDAIFAARDLLDSLHIPYHVAGGNSDFQTNDSRNWFRHVFYAQLPEGKTHYSFDYKGLHFVILDPWWRWADGTICPYSDDTPNECGWMVPPEQYEWLGADLAQNSSKPTLVISHFPALPVPARLYQKGMVEHGVLSDGEFLMDMLCTYKQVRGYIGGHAHVHYAIDYKGLMHIVTGALIEYPVEYRDIRVYDDHIEFHACGLSDTTFAEQSLIAAKTWVAGETCDRIVSVAL